MATFRAYRNGFTMGVPNMAPTGGKRGEIVGWSPGAVRRHKRWLYSIEASGLSGYGSAITLTVRETPPTSEEWRDLLETFFRYLRRDPRILRWHWVVEWQRRGTPHLHLAVYGTEDVSARVTAYWLGLTMDYGSSHRGQHSEPIYGHVGWLKYLSKHASRGVKHYQRQGKPPGWSKTGRLWGKGGQWPETEEMHGVLSDRQMHRVRRMVRGYCVADARMRGDWRALAYLRRMLKSGTDRSHVRGMSEWVPESVFVRMLRHAGWDGELAQPSTG